MDTSCVNFDTVWLSLCALEANEVCLEWCSQEVVSLHWRVSCFAIVGQMHLNQIAGCYSYPWTINVNCNIDTVGLVMYANWLTKEN